MSDRRTWITIGLGLLLIAGCADQMNGSPSRSESPAAGPTEQPLNQNSVMTLAKIQEVNQLEVEAGQIAQQRGSQAVQGYGRMLVEDHRRSHEEIAAMLQQQGVTIQGAADAFPDVLQMRQEMQQVAQLSGEDFDRAFLTAMAADHQMLVQELQGVVSSLEPQDVRDLVQKVIPVLQKHESQARQILEEQGYQVSKR